MLIKQQQSLKRIGYEYMGEFGISGRRYLRKGGDERTYSEHGMQNDDTIYEQYMNANVSLLIWDGLP